MKAPNESTKFIKNMIQQRCVRSRKLTRDVLDNFSIFSDTAAEELELVDDFVDRNRLGVKIRGRDVVIKDLLAVLSDRYETVQGICRHFLVFRIVGKAFEDGRKNGAHVEFKVGVMGER